MSRRATPIRVVAGLLVVAAACSADRGDAPDAAGDTDDELEPPPLDPVPPDDANPEDSGSTGDVEPDDDSGDSDDGSDGSETGGDPDDGPAYDGPRTVLVHLFEWTWADIAEECETVLGPAGFEGVQVSPPQEHALIPGAPWWERYQPVSYALVGRSGDEAAFADMVQRCADAGVEIYVDAILNHMAFGAGLPGSGGTEFTKYEYPGLYADADFHECRQGIQDWGSRYEIHNCELATLPDLATEEEHVRATLRGYLQHLLDLGVAGFRFDAAKHVPIEDLEAIVAPLTPAPDIYQEVIHLGDGEVVSAYEYTGLGRVTEFRYGIELSNVFRGGQLSWLDNFGSEWGLLPDDDALVLIDNHDNQRGHGAGDPLTHQDEGLYRVAVAFMLAWPYGRPKLMSSYAIEDGDHGPPASPACDDGWICEHRWGSTLGMVGFRNATVGEGVTHWWSNGNDQIAFGRGERGFFVLNREEVPTLDRVFDTGLPAGTYCDVFGGGMAPDGTCTGAEITVGIDGTAAITVGPLDSVAFHVQARRDG